MATTQGDVAPGNTLYALVTGANSGIGLAISRRLTEEFLQTRPQTESLVLIVTTRDQKKGNATIENLCQHLLQVNRQHERKVPGISQILQRRIEFRQERLDLLSLRSVQELCKKLRDTIPKLDIIICNAGIGGWTGIDWPLAVFKILTTWRSAVSWPTYKISGLGWVTKAQLPVDAKVEEPPLGQVFCANFFGHYLLGHYLGPLLAKHPPSQGASSRIIWVSSIEAYEHALDMADIQGIGSTTPYESSKRLTDVMALTSALPSLSPVVNQYFGCHTGSAKITRPRIYTAHPGICGTAIMTIPLILQWAMFAAFYVARWLGSPWHPITAEKGACAMVWLALAKQSVLDNMEEKEGAGKWGSATDFWGQERVERTEVEGWGWGGRMGEHSRRRGRHPSAKDLTEESQQKFVEVGKACWGQMEKLRTEWEDRLKKAGAGINMHKLDESSENGQQSQHGSKS